MKYTNELFKKYEIRKNKKQKSDFINWISKICNENNWKVNIEKGIFGTKNIIIGNPDEAKIIFTAHYDTCAVMLFPNFITPKNIFIYLLYQILLCLILMIPIIGLSIIFSIFFPQYIEISFTMGYIIMIIELILLMFGPANKHTANDNTSGVATIIESLEKFNPQKDNVAFILFDGEEIGLIGSNSFTTKHKKIAKNTLLVNFDCVSDGDTMLFVLNKKTKNLKNIFEKSYKNSDIVKTDIVNKGVLYPSDQMMFNKGIGVCAIKKNKIFQSGYIDKIHTNKDTNFRKENIKYLIEGNYELYQNITKEKTTI